MIRTAIKKQIKEKGITQAQVAEFLGIGKASVCLYLKGERSLSEDNEERLLRWLDLEIKPKS